MSNPHVESCGQLQFSLGILDQGDNFESVVSQHQCDVPFVRPKEQWVWRVLLNLILLFKVAFGDQLCFLGLLVEA